jgi:hypothetical protein
MRRRPRLRCRRTARIRGQGHAQGDCDGTPLSHLATPFRESVVLVG